METQEIAQALKLTAALMELHEENPFKVRSLSNAAYKLGKSGIVLEGLSPEELEKIDGVGKGIAFKINELNTTGSLKELDDLLSRTPAGVIEMTRIKGIGPKKVAVLWKELGVESPGELLYACNENRLVELKGFGEKTQEQVKKAILFTLKNAGKFHYAAVENLALEIVKQLKEQTASDKVSLTGAVRRKCNVVEKIEVLVGVEGALPEPDVENSRQVPVEIKQCAAAEFYYRLFQMTGSEAHVKVCLEQAGSDFDQDKRSYNSEKEIYQQLGLTYVEPEMREDNGEIAAARNNTLPVLIEMQDLKGILHNHSTYSDGMNSLREMAEYCKELGYEYLGICDHSKSAFYANGLQAERVTAQHKEIEQLNQDLAPFKIFKGIESDILYDGSLDYDEEVLKSFDFIVASVHSNLKMDAEKATQRLLTAIENPYTTILGHMTGRLLLAREGYPVDHKKIIDACAEHGVVIELNAHPYRLDIDWKWIPYCLEKGVKISINPDAHQKQGYHDMYYGLCSARKGGLYKEMCLNAMSRGEIEAFFNAG